MRVLAVGNLYPPHHLGGYELVWHAAMLHLLARGDEVRVLTGDHREAEPEPSIAEHPGVHRELALLWRDHRFPRLGIRERLALERRNLATLDRHLREFEPDVVSWWSMGGVSMSLIERVRARGIPAVGFVHDEWLVYGPVVDGLQRLASRGGAAGALAARGLRTAGVPAPVDFDGAACWAFVSALTRRNALGARPGLSRTELLHSGVDLELFGPQPERSWGWRLLYVGRLDPRKGVEVAIRAVAELPEATLLVIGGGDRHYLERLRALARGLGVGRRVAFERRPRAELPSTYAEADAVVFPVLWEEPWGLVPLEAMASGRPVVATGAGGSGELLRDGENCVRYAPRDDPRALAVSLRTLAADRALRLRLREAGFETAARVSQRAFVEGVAALLERAAGHPGRR